MKLALRHSPEAGANRLHRLALKAIKVRLVTRYPHAGIVIGDKMYHATLSKGVHSSDFNPAIWKLIDLGGDDELALQRFKLRQGRDYDLFSLIAFVGIKARDSERDYCYELAHYIMTGELATRRVTVEDLLIIALDRVSHVK